MKKSMQRNSSAVLSALVLFGAGVVHGENLETRVAADTPKSSRLELGVGGGFPVGLGMVVGYWGGPKLPVVARLALGAGAQVDLGIELDPESNLKKYVVASGGAIGFFNVLPDTIYSVGVSAGLKYKAFFVQAGPAMAINKDGPHWVPQGLIGASASF